MRLAYEQGFLTQKNLSYFQHWGLLYALYLNRRTALEDTRAMLIQQTLNLDPERWVELYRDEMLRELGLDPDHDEEFGGGHDEIPLEASDYDALDQFLRQQENNAVKRMISGGQLPPDYVPDTVGRLV